MTEIWKSIKNYEGLYEISNLGRVKSLERKITYPDGHPQILKERILKTTSRPDGYLCVNLSKNSMIKTFAIHRLVWDYFGKGLRNSKKLQIDHINADKSNNNITNLQLLTIRENTTKGYRDRGRTLPTGVGLHKPSNRYVARIIINNKYSHLGYFSNPQEASFVYQKALENLSAY